MATQAEIAVHLDLSQGAVSKFLAEQSIERTSAGYDLAEVRVAYIRRIRTQAAGHTGADGKQNLITERAKLAALQVDAHTMKNELARGELLPRLEVVAAMQDANARVRARLLAIPPRAAPIVAAMAAPVEVQAKLTEFVHEALAELAGTEVTSDADHEPGSGRGGPRLVAGVRPAAETDGERVGGHKPRAQQRGKRRARKVVDQPG